MTAAKKSAKKAVAKKTPGKRRPAAKKAAKKAVAKKTPGKKRPAVKKAKKAVAKKTPGKKRPAAKKAAKKAVAKKTSGKKASAVKKAVKSKTNNPQAGVQELDLVEIESEDVDEYGNVVVDDIVALVDNEGNIIAIDETSQR